MAEAGAKLEKITGLHESRPLNNLIPGAPIEMIRMALELGASPNEMGQTLTLTFPILTQYANRNRLDAVKLRIERDSGVKVARQQGPHRADDGRGHRAPESRDGASATQVRRRSEPAWAPVASKAEARRAINAAAGYLERSTATGTQDAAFQLPGLKWAGGSLDTSELRAKVLALQREDAGWGQRPTMPSDVYATGQALYALRTTAGVPANHKAWRRGVERDAELPAKRRVRFYSCENSKLQPVRELSCDR